MHPAALGPGLVLASGIAAFAVFSAFLPDHARSIGFAGSGGLFAAYSVVCLVLRIVGARLPERLGARRAVTIAFVTLAAALGGAGRVPGRVGAVGAAVVIGVGMAFMYPSLMALTVNRVDERERPVAISSFTMFFEVGTVSGGHRARPRRPAVRQAGVVRRRRACCARSACGCCAPASPRADARRDRRPRRVGPAVYVPVAGD